jgi:hypothetical protein
LISQFLLGLSLKLSAKVNTRERERERERENFFEDSMGTIKKQNKPVDRFGSAPQQSINEL